MSAATLPDLNLLPAEALKALILAQHEQLLWRDSEIEHLKLPRGNHILAVKGVTKRWPFLLLYWYEAASPASSPFGPFTRITHLARMYMDKLSGEGLSERPMTQ
jgi:hypothetical protein